MKRFSQNQASYFKVGFQFRGIVEDLRELGVITFDCYWTIYCSRFSGDSTCGADRNSCDGDCTEVFTFPGIHSSFCDD